MREEVSEAREWFDEDRFGEVAGRRRGISRRGFWGRKSEDDKEEGGG